MKIKMLASVILAGALLHAAGPAAAQLKELKFGCYAPMTGQWAVFGRSIQNGIDMAIDDFAKTAQAKGLKFTIRCEDDQGRADDGINLARKFIEDPAMLASIGSWSSTVTLAAGPIYNQAKLVSISPASSHPDVTKIGPYVFRQSVTQQGEGAFNGRYLQQLGVKTLAMIGLPNDYGKANVSQTRANFEKVGGKVVFEEFIRPDAQDFRQTLQKAMQAKPDALYLGVFAQQAALILKQLRQMGSTLPVYVAAANESPDLIRLAGAEAVEGAPADPVQPRSRAEDGRLPQALRGALQHPAGAIRLQLVQHRDDADGDRDQAVPERDARVDPPGSGRDPRVRRAVRPDEVRPGHARVGVEVLPRRGRGRQDAPGAVRPVRPADPQHCRRCSTPSSSASSRSG